jgi:hypothetical protein
MFAIAKPRARSPLKRPPDEARRREHLEEAEHILLDPVCRQSHDQRQKGRAASPIHLQPSVELIPPQRCQWQFPKRIAPVSVRALAGLGSLASLCSIGHQSRAKLANDSRASTAGLRRRTACFAATAWTKGFMPTLSKDQKRAARIYKLAQALVDMRPHRRRDDVAAQKRIRAELQTLRAAELGSQQSRA